MTLSAAERTVSEMRMKGESLMSPSQSSLVLDRMLDSVESPLFGSYGMQPSSGSVNVSDYEISEAAAEYDFCERDQIEDYQPRSGTKKQRAVSVNATTMNQRSPSMRRNNPYAACKNVNSPRIAREVKNGSLSPSMRRATANSSDEQSAASTKMRSDAQNTSKSNGGTTSAEAVVVRNSAYAHAPQPLHPVPAGCPSYMVPPGEMAVCAAPPMQYGVPTQPTTSFSRQSNNASLPGTMSTRQVQQNRGAGVDDSATSKQHRQNQPAKVVEQLRMSADSFCGLAGTMPGRCMLIAALRIDDCDVYHMILSQLLPSLRQLVLERTRCYVVKELIEATRSLGAARQVIGALFGGTEGEEVNGVLGGALPINDEAVINIATSSQSSRDLIHVVFNCFVPTNGTTFSLTCVSDGSAARLNASGEQALNVSECPGKNGRHPQRRRPRVPRYCPSSSSYSGSALSQKSSSSNSGSFPSSTTVPPPPARPGAFPRLDNCSYVHDDAEPALLVVPELYTLLDPLIDVYMRNIELLALNPMAYISVMRIIESALPRQANKIIESIKPHLNRLAQDQYGNYVVQKVIARAARLNMETEQEEKNGDREETENSGVAAVHNYLSHKQGSPPTDQVARYIAEGALGTDSYISIEDIFHAGFSGHLQSMSCNKFSSNIIEKLLSVAGRSVRRLLIYEILLGPSACYGDATGSESVSEGRDSANSAVEDQTEQPYNAVLDDASRDAAAANIEVYLKDDYGNFVIQAVVDTCVSAEELQFVLRFVKPGLPGTPYEPRIEQKIFRAASRVYLFPAEAPHAPVGFPAVVPVQQRPRGGERPSQLENGCGTPYHGGMMRMPQPQVPLSPMTMMGPGTVSYNSSSGSNGPFMAPDMQDCYQNSYMHPPHPQSFYASQNYWAPFPAPGPEHHDHGMSRHYEREHEVTPARKGQQRSKGRKGTGSGIHRGQHDAIPDNGANHKNGNHNNEKAVTSTKTQKK